MIGRASSCTLPLLVALGACSVLLEEPDYSGSACTSDRDCAPLNDDGTSGDPCRPYQCTGPSRGDVGPSAGRCERRMRDDDSDGQPARSCGGDDCNDHDRAVQAGGAEVCDAEDNDCDGRIDEANDGEPVIAPIELARIETGSGVEHISYARDPAGEALAVWTERQADTRSAWIASLRPPAALPRRFALQIPSEEASETGAVDAPLDDSCYAWNPLPPPAVRVVEQCYAVELALAFADQTMLSAAVAVLNDARGQMRVGAQTAPDRPGMLMRGPAWRSNSYLGIDIDTTSRPGEPVADGETTGQSRRDGPLGAARPALAVLPAQDPAQAMIGWLAHPTERDECARDAVGVEALVAYLEQDRGVSWVSTTSEHAAATDTPPSAVPMVLGRAAEGIGPAVHAWPERGYLVAYGTPAGSLALHFVRAASEPVEACADRLTCPDGTPRQMPALGEASSDELAAVAAEANGAALAGIAHGDAFDLAIAWREGCGTGREYIRVRRVELRLDRNGDLAIAADTAVRTVAGPGAYGPPAIVYSDSGFEHGTGGAAATTTGGWVVAFADRREGTMLARRVGSRAGTLLDDGRALVLGDAVDADGSALATRPFLYTDEQGRVHFAYFDGGAAVIGGRFSCLPSAGSSR